MYGWRGIIGIIVPSSDTTAEMDCHELKPEGVAVYVSRVELYETSDPKEKLEALRQMDSEIPQAAKRLASVAPDIIAFCCTTGSFLEGPGTDERIIQRIKEVTNINAITTTTALVEALRYLKVSTIDLLTPYNSEIGIITRDFLRKAIPILKICNYRDLGIVGGLDKCKVPPSKIFTEAKSLTSNSSDALVISCTALQNLFIITALEHDIGKPVITSNLATMWFALKKLNIRESIGDRGYLLRETLNH